MSLGEQDPSDPLAELARVIGAMPYGEPVVIQDCVDEEIEPPSDPDSANVMRFLGGAEQEERHRAPNLWTYVPRFDDAFYPRPWLCGGLSPDAICTHWLLERIM